jgi:hypothetical protein
MNLVRKYSHSSMRQQEYKHNSIELFFRRFPTVNTNMVYSILSNYIFSNTYLKFSNL